MLTRTRRPSVKPNRRALAAITTTMAGIVTYRTRRPLPENRALSFAGAVAANGRFLDATVVKSRKADHFHVCFLPNNLDRIALMLDSEDAKDRAAANRDGRFFLYTEYAQAPGFFRCIGMKGTYDTTLIRGGSCTCPHYTFRRSSSGGRCKHIVELQRRLEAGLLEA